jgi:DNA transformation protein
VELLAPLGAVRVRRMFGGWGIYLDGLFIALIAFERLYLKADASTIDRFKAAACEPFRYEHDGREMTMSYWTAPAEALDSPPLMEPWARLALQAALTARAAKPPTRVKPARKRPVR